MKTEQHIQSLATFTPHLPRETDEGGLNLGQFVAAIRRRVLLILGVTTAVTLAAGIKAFSDTPIYSARFEILVQTESAEAEVISSLPATLSGRDTQTNIVNQDLLKILSSSKVLFPVVEELQKQFPGVCTQLVAPTGASDATADLAGEQLTDACYKALSQNLRVTTLGQDSSIVQVSYTGLNPDEVKTVLDLTSEAYLDYSLESRQADIRRAIEFVGDKLPDSTDRVAMLQDQLQQLRQQYNLIDPSSRGAELSGQVSAFKQQQLQSQVELEQARELSSDLQGQLSQGSTELAASSALSNNSRYQTLIQQLLTLDAQIAQASTIYRETTPEMQVLQEQRQNLLNLLSREGQVVQRQVEGQLRELQVRDGALQDTLGSLQAEVNDLALISRIYSDIERELQISTESLNQLLAKREALQIDAAQRQIPWELLTPTTDPQPISASLTRNLLLGGILGLLLGVGAALAMERLTDVVYTNEELKRITGLPLLGNIPFNELLLGNASVINFAMLQRVAAGISEAEEAEARSNNRNNGQRETGRRYYNIDPFAESFRSLYTNIRLLNSDSPIRSLVVSSTQPGEGKSTVAIHLAKAAASMTQRVLLVDTDLRSPKLHDYMDLPQAGGLIDVISGDLLLKDAVQRSPFEPNLFIISAGASPPDPTRLLSSQKMQRLMEQFQSNFDLVIYDAPALVGFADAYLTAANTDGMILVAEVGKLKRSLVEEALEQIKLSRTSVLGVVTQKQPLG